MKIITFHQLTEALMFEDVAKKIEPEFRLIPVPRAISSSCGLAGQTEISVEEIEKILANERIDNDGIYDEVDGKYLRIDK